MEKKTDKPQGDGFERFLPGPKEKLRVFFRSPIAYPGDNNPSRAWVLLGLGEEHAVAFVAHPWIGRSVEITTQLGTVYVPMSNVANVEVLRG